jgi:hypothetical protein
MGRAGLKRRRWMCAPHRLFTAVWLGQRFAGFML